LKEDGREGWNRPRLGSKRKRERGRGGEGRRKGGKQGGR